MTNDNNTADLEYLISKQMRMAHVYQPVMIKALLERGGEATTEEIAKSLLAYGEYKSNMNNVQVLIQNTI